MTDDLREYAYRNVTVSGLPGAGSTTLLKMLKKELKLDGWRGYSGGEFMRAYAEEKGLFDKNQKLHHSALHYEDDFDREIDMGLRQKLQTEELWIFEAWLSGFLAQGVSGVLKILLYCSDDSVRIDRIVNRDGVTVDEAKSHLDKRYHDNLNKWARMYSKEWEEWVVAEGKAKPKDQIDFWRPDLYDITIDTYRTNKEQTLKIVLDALQNKTQQRK